MHVEYTIPAAAADAVIDENWCLLKNKSTCNVFINHKNLPNIIYDPDVKYLFVYFNAGVTYTNNIGDLL